MEFCCENGARAYACVYDPTKLPACEDNRHPVQWWRQGDDLIVRFWIARRWTSRKLAYVYYPAHKQDTAPVVWNDVSTCFDESCQNGRIIALIQVRGIFASEIDWGCGLLSFIGYDNGVRGYYPVSSGFFLRSENAENFQLAGDEDPYGLRMAMARCDIEAIEHIMQTDEVAARDWIREFERNTLRALNKMGSLGYFHAYLSHCIRDDGREEISGYFFMAGWLLLEKMEAIINETDVWERKIQLLRNVRKGILPEDYLCAWSTLLISDRYFKADNFFPGISGMDENCVFGQRLRDAKMILDIKDELHEEGGYRRFWTSCQSFNDQGASHLTARLFNLIDRVQREFRLGRFNPDQDDEYFVDFDGYFSNGLPASSLERCVSQLAWRVAKWRHNPTLKGAQLLRNLLIEVWQIDSELEKCIRKQKDDYNGDDDVRNWQPKHSILERIALKADVFREVISQSNNE